MALWKLLDDCSEVLGREGRGWWRRVDRGEWRDRREENL